MKESKYFLSRKDCSRSCLLPVSAARLLPPSELLPANPKLHCSSHPPTSSQPAASTLKVSSQFCGNVWVKCPHYFEKANIFFWWSALMIFTNQNVDTFTSRHTRYTTSFHSSSARNLLGVRDDKLQRVKNDNFGCLQHTSDITGLWAN